MTQNKGQLSFQVLFVQNKGRADVLFLEFALCFVVHCPNPYRRFLSLRCASLVNAIKKEIVRLIVEVIIGVLCFGEGLVYSQLF